MTNVSKAMEYATTFEREAMRERLDAALGDVNHMSLLELEAMVLHHKQQIKDIAEHLLELRKWGSPMMEFKQEQPTKISAEYERGFDDGFILRKEKDGKRPWIGLTDEELLDAYGWYEKVENNRLWGDSDPMLEKARQDVLVGLRKVDAKLKAKNGG